MQRVKDDSVETVAQRFRLLGEPVRLRLLQKLQAGERTVNELVEICGGTQPNISRHLTALFQGGLLERRRDGVKIYYAIAEPMVFRLCDMVAKSTAKPARKNSTSRSART